MRQPPGSSAPRVSPDGLWWWDGARWLPTTRTPVVPPPALHGWVLTPARRALLITCLAVDAAVSGFLCLGGIISESQEPDAFGIGLLVLFIVIFVTAALALIGAVMRTGWGRWATLVAGIAVSLTIVGLVIGIPITYIAAKGTFD